MDRRKQALMKGLRQLKTHHLERILRYEDSMCYDKFNYEEGKFCPLAVGLGLDEWVRNPTHEKVYAILALSGLTINNTWQVEGEFYTTNREKDLREAIYCVLDERRDTPEYEQ